LYRHVTAYTFCNKYGTYVAELSTSFKTHQELHRSVETRRSEQYIQKKKYRDMYLYVRWL
jgi:hypothetical protein